jgi:hypothetical protein
VPEAVIVSALRTPIGTAMKGTLRDTDAYQLADHIGAINRGRRWIGAINRGRGALT